MFTSMAGLNIVLVILLICVNSFVLSQEVYRLSNNTKPLNYEIELRVDTRCDATKFNGHVNITIEVLRTNDFITLHKSKEVTISKLNVREGSTAATTEEPEQLFNEKTEILTIKLGEQIEEGRTYILEIVYEAKISTDKLGFYQSYYLNDAGETVCLMSTQFAPTQARRAFPCYDEPSYKAEYEIRIIHPVGTSAISNEKPIDFIHRDDETVLTIFDKVPLMPTYLVGFAVTDFAYRQNISSGIAHRVYSRTNALDYVTFALEFAEDVYKYLANYFQIPLPLAQLKHVAIPDFYFSAMENWGMITYKESRFLFNRELHPANLMHSISNVIAHEITHHWFGDMVTMKWWTHVWLKEGFATLFSYLGQEDVRPEYQAIQFLLAERLHSVFTVDSDPNIKPMSKYIEIQSDIMANYDRIAYDKACCVLRMMRHAFTDAVFKKALGNYINRHKFGNTDEDDLFNAFEESLPDDSKDFPVATAMRSWTQQSGYPVVTVSLRQLVLHIQQERFYLKNPKEDPVEPSVWWIPLTFVDINGEVKDYWLNETEDQLNCRDFIRICGPGEFFLVNYEQNGYYRVNYDEDHWNVIANVLKVNHNRIHVNNRAQLVDDAFSLAFVGRLSYSTAFNVVEYIGREEEYAPWAAFKRGVTTLKQYLSGNSNIEQLNKFIQTVVSQAYQNIALSNNVSKYIRKFSRQIIVNMACEFGLKGCLQEKRIYDYPDLREVYYCNKLRSGGNNLYSGLRNMLKNTTEPIIRAEIISSLGCSNDRTQLAVILLMAIDKTENYMLTDTERVQLIQSVYRKSYLGVVETLNFFDNEEVKSVILATDLERMCLDFAKYISTYDLSIKFGKVMENVMTTSKLNEARAIIRENLFWIADFGTTALNTLGNKSNSANVINCWIWTVLGSITLIRYNYF